MTGRGSKFKFPMYPPPHTQCAIGSYTKVPHKRTKMTSALNFILSTKPPTMRAGVIMANVAWNIANN